MSETSERTGAAALDHVTVAEAMTAGVLHCDPETPVYEVARQMAANRVHAVFVQRVDEGAVDDAGASEELWGVVSDLDVLDAAAQGLLDRPARELAGTPLVTLAGNEPLGAAVQALANERTTHLAVLDPRTRRPIGVLSTLDVARELAAAQSV